MILRIKAPREEFDAAESGGDVYGVLIRQKSLYVYVELGLEYEYIRSNRDDPRTEYRIFKGCRAYIAESENQLDRSEYISQTEEKITVVIYC